LSPRATINDLPSPCLEHVFSFITDACTKLAILQTCKQWHAVASGSPEFWRQAHIAGSKLQVALREGGAQAKRLFLSRFSGRVDVIQNLRISTTADFNPYVGLLLRATAEAAGSRLHSLLMVMLLSS
jgi:hypothetical protein